MSAPHAVGLRFELRREGAPPETLLVDAGRARIGSAAHCEVRLPPETCAPEHLEVVESDGEIHVTARAHDPAAFLDGAPFTSVPWPRGHTITLGPLVIGVTMVDLAVQRRPPSLLWLLAPVTLVVAAFTFLYRQGAAAAEAPIPDAPPLFDAPALACNVHDRDAIAEVAGARERVAASKRERGPFAPREAVEAVPLFELASRCYAAAGDDVDARANAESAADLRRRLEEEYRLRRVRLEHAYRVNDPAGAKRELRALIPMIAHRPGAYADWLAMLDRYADIEIEQRTGTRL